MNPTVPPLPPLDPLTLCLAVSVLGFLLAAITANMARGAPQHRTALHLWSATMATAGTAFGLYYLRGWAPFLLTYVLGNSLALCVPALALHAHARLVGLRLGPLPAIGTVVVGAVCAVAGWAGLVSLNVSAGLLSALGGGLMLSSVAVLLPQRQVRRSLVAMLGAAAATFTGIGFVARAFMAFGGAGSVQMVHTTGPNPQLAPVLLLSALFIVAASMGFFAVVHEQQRLQMVEHARRDGLTGTYTRSAFFELAAGQPGALLMLDIDHFKRVNDQFGHRGGDLTLAHAARLVTGAVRIGDLVGRYGGEEFCVLLHGCGLPEAAALAQRLVNDARDARVRLADGRSVSYTLSAGYAVRADGEPLEEALARADAALYRAKHAGRDRAEAAPQVQTSSV